MENPVDHTIDLGFVNYVQHPENKDYIVFRFVDKERADSFKEGLESEGIWFEDDTSEKRQKPHYLFAIHHRDFKKCEKLNFKVEAKHKKPFIPFKGLRMVVMIISFGILLLAVLGYCAQQKKLNEIEQLLEQNN